MLVKDLAPKVQSQNIIAKRRTIQCDNAIQITGFKILVASTELESLYRLDKKTAVIYIPLRR